ncbi:MAG: mercury(II) reductase [Chlorobi bacterium]|nr:mercury(II) reductase [Chlorobiota bacterium]
MTCDHCASGIQKHLSTKDGIIENHVSYKDKIGEFKYDPEKISKEVIQEIIDKETHYKVVAEIDDKAGKPNNFDLIIIGGGSAAFSAAIKANSLGLSTLMVNAGLDFGGTCVNVGCVPSKNLIRAAETVYHANHSNFKGIKPQGADIDFGSLIKGKKQLVNELQKKKYMDVVSDFDNLVLLKGWAEFVDNKTIIVDGKEKFTALKILIASGSTTKIPAIKGLSKINYLTNISLFDIEEQPKSLIVLGGGYIALEIAQAYHRLGTKVILLQRSVNILSRLNPEISEELLKHLRNEGMEIHTGLDFEEASENETGIIVKAKKSGKPQIFGADKILVSTGTRPNTYNLGLEKTEVETEKSGHIKVDDHLQTSQSNIYAAGDCINTPAYVYTAAHEGRIAVENAFSGTDFKIDYSSLPWVVFTDPQIAGTGIDEAEAIKMNIPFETSRIELKDIPRAIAANDTRGFIKLIRNKETDMLIGARIVAPEGGELIQQLSMAIKYGIAIKELSENLYPYLTLSEGIKLAAITFGKDVSKLSCCAS